MDANVDLEMHLAARRHDLRTPINAIIGYSEMLLEDLDDAGDPRVELLRRIERAGKSLSTSVDEVLRSPAATPGSTAIDLEALAERARVELRSDINSVVGYAELLIESPDVDDDFVADVERVREAAWQMNALIDRIVEPADSKEVLAEVVDEQQRAMVRRLIVTVQEIETRRRIASEAPGRVLVVDDNAANRELLGRRLAREGHECTFAENGQAALRLAEAEPPDVILLDILMPEMDGYQVLQHLKANPALSDIPVIVLSGMDHGESVVRCIELGADDFLPKPFDPVLLRARIGASLEKKRLRDREKEYLRALSAEREKSERLLLNILPASVAEQLKGSEATIAEHFPAASVLFADLVGFTSLSSRIDARDLIDILNDVFSTFDHLAATHGVEKIKTIGDAYMAVGGLPTPQADHAARVAGLALDMLDAIKVGERLSRYDMDVRIGIHSGPVVAGVIGASKFAYDLWGDTVNTASRMESTGVPGSVQVSATMVPLLEPTYLLERRGMVEAKGKGLLETYFLVGRRPRDP